MNRYRKIFAVSAAVSVIAGSTFVGIASATASTSSACTRKISTATNGQKTIASNSCPGSRQLGKVAKAAPRGTTKKPPVSKSTGPVSSSPRSPAPVPKSKTDPLTVADLNAVKAKRIFFAHQSVGGNILQGIPMVYSANGVSAPNMIGAGALANSKGGAIADAPVGANGDPLGKDADFNRQIRGGIGNEVNIAFFKYCFVDVTANTDVTTLFNDYRTKMAALQRDYPNVKFLYVTNPLTTDDPASNVKREQLNTLMRKQYASSGRLFDLAKVESTAPNGSRVSGTYQGAKYYSLYNGYASDNGHLNSAGEQAAAKSLLQLLARV